VGTNIDFEIIPLMFSGVTKFPVKPYLSFQTLCSVEFLLNELTHFLICFFPGNIVRKPIL
jgi:hypothetical protein